MLEYNTYFEEHLQTPASATLQTSVNIGKTKNLLFLKNNISITNIYMTFQTANSKLEETGYVTVKPSLFLSSSP